jgi:hypothetical protein
VVAEAGAVQVQVVQLDVGEATRRPGGELLADGIADPADGRAAQRCLWAERLSQRRLDVAGRQAADKPGDHQRLQRVGPRHVGAEQSGREPLVGATQLRTGQCDGAAGRLHGDGLVAVAIAGSAVGIALVTLPAQERGDLGLQCGLQQQSSAEPGDLLDHLAQVTSRVGEQLVDLGADTRNG